MYNNSSKFSKNQKPIELIGIIPRSIIRTLNRFIIQLFPNSNYSLIRQEFEISRYQFNVSIGSLIILIFVPLVGTFLAKTFVFIPLTQYIWNTQTQDIFLNSFFEKEALLELQKYEEQLFFDYFVSPKSYETPIWASYQIGVNLNKFPDILNSQLQKKTLELATEYNQKSIEALANLCSDFFSFGTFILLVRSLKPEIIILKSFLLESIYNLSDTTKSFLLIFSTDLLVGFHSPRGWELILEFVLNRIGFPHDENFIFLFVATLPVLLDTVFKYWVFRYLNKISPSTVATYHSILE
uniref:Potassium/proton antiporter CemA n=1 Tax=Hazenia capsulata TaxID=2202518 RepID=A0A1W6EHE3_9CHLO|nr:chloroplast enveloppe membrane protein [Hazenia capsulata]ARK14828.1 chloroplast enveloppe membrane protein [Hazenia capsulata]